MGLGERDCEVLTLEKIWEKCSCALVLLFRLRIGENSSLEYPAAALRCVC